MNTTPAFTTGTATTVLTGSTPSQSVSSERRARVAEPRRIPLTRIITVELLKSFDTRSGFWLMAAIAIAALLTTGAVIAWAPESEFTYSQFTLAIGFPMSVILPIIAVLAITGEWSQRSGLTTFTLIPHRGRVILAKVIASVAVGIAAMLFALAVGVVGNLVGSAAAGTDVVWDVSFAHGT